MTNSTRTAARRRPTDAEPKAARRKATGDGPSRHADAEWELRLYIAGQTPRALTAIQNLHQLCEKHLAGRYRVEVIDLLVNPQLARGDQILAVPTLVRKLPTPVKKIIGDLAQTERVLVGLDLRPRT